MTDSAPLRRLIRPLERTNRPDLQVLSVYREHGVVPKSSRSDNFNKTPEDVSRYLHVRAGDLVVNKMKAWSGSVAVSQHEGIVSADYLVCGLRPGLDARYLHHLLRSPRFVTEMRVRSVGIRPNQERLYWDDLAQIQIPTPAVDEQRRIADFLDDRVARIDQIITARREQEKVLREQFESMRLDAVLGQQRTRPTDLPWAPAVPESWPVRRLSQLARMGTGHTPSRSEPSYWVDCDVSWLTTTDVHKFRRDEIDVIESTEISISDLGLANSAAVLHPSNTVALSRTASAGFSVIMGPPMATSQDFVTWTCGPDLMPEYLLHTLRVMRPYLLGFLSIGSTHKTIYFPDLMDLRIPLPPLPYQSDAIARVGEAAASRNTALTAIRQQVVLLTEYKQSLITAAVSGELDVSTAGSGMPG